MGVVPNQYNPQMRCPSYQMNSKRKSHIGCCQMCIKMVKTSAKTLKTKGA